MDEPGDRDRPLLVLDLDQTLIVSFEEPLSRPPDFAVTPYFSYKRPFLALFLDCVSKLYRLAVFSSSERQYAEKVVKAIFPADMALDYILSRDQCVRRVDAQGREQIFLKDLRVLDEYTLDRVVVAEDQPETFPWHRENVVPVLPFVGETSDTELALLEKYLLALACAPEVRSVWKTGWGERNRQYIRKAIAGAESFAWPENEPAKWHNTLELAGFDRMAACRAVWAFRERKLQDAEWSLMTVEERTRVIDAIMFLECWVD